MRPASFVFLFVLLSLAGAPAGAQKTALRIADLLSRIENGQPQVRAYRERANAAGYGIGLAKNTLVPDLSAGYQAGLATDNNITGMSYPGLIMPISGPVSTRSSYEMIPGTALTGYLQWRPLTFGQREAAVEKASAQFRLAGASYDQWVFRQRYAGILVYLDIVYLGKLLTDQQADIRRTEAGLEQSLVLAKEGLRPGLDTVQFQSRLAHGVMERLTTLRLYQSQVLELCRLAGLDGPAESYVFTDTLVALRLPATPDTSGVFSQNPAYRYQEQQVALSDANLKQAGRAWRPSLDLWANAYSRGSGIAADGAVDKSAGWSLTRNNYGAGVQLSFPILQFSRVNLQKKQYRALLQADQAQLSQTRTDLQKQLEAAVSNYNVNILIAAQAPVQSRAARLSYEGLSQAYQSGLIDFTRLSQGQYELLNAEMMEAGARLQVWRSLLEIGAAKGNLKLFTNQLQ